MLERAASKKILDDVLAAGKKLGREADVRCSLTAAREQNVRFGRGEITSAGDTSDQVLSVTVSFGKRHATAVGNQPSGARALVEQAARLARLAPEDPEWMPPLGPQRIAAVDGFDEATARQDAKTRAAAAGAALALGKSDKLEISGFYQSSLGSYTVASSAGLFAHHAATKVRFTCTARSSESGSGWAGQQSHRAGDLDAAAAARIAADKARQSSKPRALPAGRYTVILEPAAVAELTAFLTGSLDARRADEGRSFFSKPGGGSRLGEAVLGKTVSLSSDPGDVAAGGMPFDGEGTPTPRVTWIDQGKLQNLHSSRFWAAKQQRAQVARSASYTLAGGTASTADLLKGVERGVWITRFWYTRSLDPRTIAVTGLTRDGVFLVEKGAVVGPVNNFRWNESPVSMLSRADLFGPSLIVPGQDVRAPALRTHEFNLASVSDAV